MRIEPQVGARITAFGVDGHNMLTGADVDPNNFGSTFWTSPQSTWGWPPVFEVDSAPYVATSCAPTEHGGPSLVCAGQVSEELGVAVTKRFRPLDTCDGIEVEYLVTNHGSAALSLAPWEISRVRGGLTFFAAGEPVAHPVGHVQLPVTRDLGAVWFDYRREHILEDQKLFAHSAEGWLGHISGTTLLLKRFEPVAPQLQAPGEAMIEIFASGAADYVEIEQQGPCTLLPPGERRGWKVIWSLHPVPSALLVKARRRELLQFAQRLGLGGESASSSGL